MKITSLRPLHCARVRLSQTSLLIPFHNILCNILIKFHVRCVCLVGWCVCTGLIIVYVARDQSSNPAKAWLVGSFGFNGPLRQYFSLYRAVSQREGERGERIDESKNVQTTPTRTYCKRNRPLPYCNRNSRTPRHWKLTQHHRTTRPPPRQGGILL